MYIPSKSRLFYFLANYYFPSLSFVSSSVDNVWMISLPLIIFWPCVLPFEITLSTSKISSYVFKKYFVFFTFVFFRLFIIKQLFLLLIFCNIKTVYYLSLWLIDYILGNLHCMKDFVLFCFLLFTTRTPW